MANDQHDNEQTDREMLSRYERVQRDGGEIVIPRGEYTYGEQGGLESLRDATGRLITRADLDQWSFPADLLQAEQAARFEPTDDDYVNWREAADYYDDAPDPGE